MPGLPEKILEIFKVIKKNIEEEVKASEFTVKSCGTRNEQLNSDISLETGYWQGPSAVASKPQRWIIHLNKENEKVMVDLAKDKEGNLLQGANTIGYINNREGNCVVIIFRIRALIKQDTHNYISPGWEWLAVMIFGKPLPAGTSGETISNFNEKKGTISYAGKEYKVSALLIYKTKIENENSTLSSSGEISYDDATDALVNFLNVENPAKTMIVKKADLRKESLDEVRKLVAEITATEIKRYQIPKIEPNASLYGIDDRVYEQITAALKAGKKHMILYGPPGTGKTTLAQYIASELSSSGEYEMLTASSSWTSQELIGGYQPIGNGKIGFVPGAILRNFDRPIVIDELNRCPIDKVMGPLFSVLSGQATTLPYKVNLEEKDSLFHMVFPTEKEEPRDNEWFPSKEWRLIATLNTVDKSQLGQISYALSRRFAWIKIGVPNDLKKFILFFINREEGLTLPNPIADLWTSINKIRPIGGAPIIDIIRTLKELQPDIDFLTEPDERYKDLLLVVLEMYILPLLDGISRTESDDFLTNVSNAWKLNDAKKDDLAKEMEDIIA